MARLTTSEPKCAQLPTEKMRMMPICSAMTAAGLETDGEIERERRREVEIEARPRGLGQRHGPHRAKNSNDWDFTGILAGAGA